MSDYKITSADFVTPGESLEPDAYIDMTTLSVEAKKTKMAEFLRSQITDKAIQDERPYEIKIMREQKYNG